MFGVIRIAVKNTGQALAEKTSLGLRSPKSSDAMTCSSFFWLSSTHDAQIVNQFFFGIVMPYRSSFVKGPQCAPRFRKYWDALRQEGSALLDAFHAILLWN